MLEKNNSFTLEKLKGKFIVFEGPHASGKTTVAKEFVKFIEKEGITTKYTKEPYKKEIINIIANKEVEESKSPVLLYLLAADRYLHTKEIKKWLLEKTCVVCDRYILSSLVYQQIQGFSSNKILETNYFIIKPDFTVGFIADLETRKKRLRRDHRNRNSIFLSETNLQAEQNYYNVLFEDMSITELVGEKIIIDGRKESSALVKEIKNQLLYKSK
jgi:dTMP kinase